MSVSDLTFQGSISHFAFDKKSVTEVHDESPEFSSRDVDNIDNHYDRIIEGWANTNTLDRVNDVVDPEAFQKSLDTYKMNPILRYNHKTGEVVGKVLDLKIVQGKGLWIKAQIAKGTPEADKVWKLILQGALRAFSIYGKIVSKGQKRLPDGKVIQNVTEFDLQEIAVVDVPANQESIFTIVSKGVNPMSDADEQKNTTPVEEPLKVTEKGVEMENQLSNDPSQSTEKERGNEQISAETQLEKSVNRMVMFQQKTLEVLVTLAEGQAATTEKLNALADLVGKGSMDGAGDDFDFEDDESEEKGFDEEEEGMEEEDEEEKEMEGMEDEEDDEEESEKSLADYESLAMKINALDNQEEKSEIQSLKDEIADLKNLLINGVQKSASMPDMESEADDEEEEDEEEEEAEKTANSKTSEVRDINVEEGVQKALIRVEEQKSAESNGSNKGEVREVGALLRNFLQKSIQ